jgi:hypothetical protein
MLYLVLPNLAFFLLGREFFISRALINSDYLLLWVGSCYLSRRTTIVLYVGLVSLDLILSTESIYHFSTVESLVMARELLTFNPAVFYPMVGGLLLLAMAALVAARRRGMVRSNLSKQRQVLIGIAALAASAATVVRSFDLIDSDLEKFGDSPIVASSVAETGLSSFELAMAPGQSNDIFPAPSAATSQVVRDLSLQGKRAGPYDIVLILVESQGLLKNASDMRRVLAPLTDPAIQDRYAVDTGAVRFYGATMFGELRTLCRIYMPRSIPTDQPGLDRCLPNLLSRLGYETVSYHGFNGWFYERTRWYPTMGFQRSYFADELKAFAPPSAICGMFFKGICDLWIADQVEHELATRPAERKFIYWLTLNSHLPVDYRLASESGFDCAGTETLREEIGPCNLARIHFQLYSRIARLALNRRIPPTRFIVVGDHMPPFATLSERALYDEDRVPFVELIPRSVSKSSTSGFRLLGPR